ncbi:MAG: tetratricopeptide repeat protein [Acidobacteriaceae bacterium]|nr:tetratricopeptide repeat protein [Acidobacteriaceae bacterium]
MRSANGTSKIPEEQSLTVNTLTQTWRNRRFRAALAAFVIAILFASTAIAQRTRSPDTITIRGTVVDGARTPIAGAAVRLEQKGTPGALETMTNASGAFVFPALQPGTYTLTAEKSVLRSQAAKFNASSPGDQNSVELVLDPASAAVDMTFADQPNFTVAGIVDRTAAAGHGSDTNLRASESLARDAAILKPNPPPGVVDSKQEASLRAQLASAPDSFDTNHRLGEFCLRAGSYREAIPLLETAFQIDPANRGNEYDLALAQKEAGDFGAARIHAQNLLAHQDTADLHSLLGDLDEQTADPLSAVREYALAVHLDPSEENYFKWGSELLLHRAVEPAAGVFTQGSETHPASARMLAALGAALFAAGRYDEAAHRLCAASDLNAADSSPYIFLGRIDAVAPAPLPCVEPKLHRFLDLQPGDARANYYYAMALWKRQKVSDDPHDLEPVEKLLAEAVSLDPSYDEAFLQLGVLYFTEHNYQNAITFYTKAIDINPQLSEAHYRLGVVYERMGQPVKAREQFRLHADLEKQQATAAEQQRREVKQFLVVLGQPAAPPSTD